MSQSSSQQRRSFLIDSALLGVTVVSLTSAAYLWIRRSRDLNDHQDVVANWKRKRQEERTGRVRAEVKLREALAKVQLLNSLNSNGSTDNHEEDSDLIQPLRSIGTILSPYPKRMGTPRQGALVPSSRGCIQFSSTLSPETLDGIQEYSHLWVIFQFHENTSLATSKKTKIRPPRGGGIKVGQLSTRSPHRPNDIGLSLVTIDRWEPSTRRLYIRALDLVNGTPVYDVKPYVHWDIPSEVTYDISGLKLPKWVESKDDVLASVSFETKAETSLQQLVENDKLSPVLYPNKDPTSFAAAKQTLTEILAQDPRSSHRGLTKNQRGTLSSDPESKNKTGISSQSTQDDDQVYRLMFGNATVEFVVEEIGAIVKDIFLRLVMFSGGNTPSNNAILSQHGARRKRQRRNDWSVGTVIPYSLLFLLLFVTAHTVVAFSGVMIGRGSYLSREEKIVVAAPRTIPITVASSLRTATQLAMATSSKDLKQKQESEPVLRPGKLKEKIEATKMSTPKQSKASEGRRTGTNNVVSRLARAAREAHEARKRQLASNNDDGVQWDHTALNEEKSKTQSKYPTRHKRKPKRQNAYDPVYENIDEKLEDSIDSNKSGQNHLSTISTLNSVIDEELLHPPNGLKPLREVDSLRLLLEHNNLINKDHKAMPDVNESDVEATDVKPRRKKIEVNKNPAHEAAIILAKPLISDQVTIEYASRLVSLAKAIKYENYKPEWICFCPSLAGNIGIGGQTHDSSELHGQSIGYLRNSVPDTAAGVIFFRHLCAANDISLDAIGICQVTDNLSSKRSGTSDHGALGMEQTHHSSLVDTYSSWSPAFFLPTVESLVDEGYLERWLEQSTDFESETDEYGMTREEPRKKVEIHWTLFSTDHELCNLNDIHVRSPRQSPMWHLAQDLENMVRQKMKVRRGILHTTWSFRYSVYPYVVYPHDTSLSLRDTNADVVVGSTDSNLMAFLGKCYLMAQELVPLMVNLRGVAENSEFFQRDNYRRLVKTRRSLATLLEQMNEAYRHNREYKSETLSIPPTLKSQLKQISPNTKSGQFQEFLSKSQPNSSTEIQLESALFSLGRCCDLVRPAGTFSAQSVSRQEWRDALSHLYDFMYRIALFCDPDQPLPAKLWGVQIMENEPVLRSLISHGDDSEGV